MTSFEYVISDGDGIIKVKTPSNFMEGFDCFLDDFKKIFDVKYEDCEDCEDCKCCKEDKMNKETKSNNDGNEKNKDFNFKDYLVNSCYVCVNEKTKSVNIFNNQEEYFDYYNDNNLTKQQIYDVYFYNNDDYSKTKKDKKRNEELKDFIESCSKDDLEILKKYI